MKKSARRKKEIKVEKKVEAVVEAVVSSEPKKVKKIFKNKPFLIGSLVILVMIIASIVLYATAYLSKDAQDPTSAQLPANDVKKLLDEVGEKVVLPEGENPTIATVTDIEKLSSQPFFKNAQNGDKVIIFGSTKEAILYRPSIKKVITIAPVNANNTQQTTSLEASGSASTTSLTTTPTPVQEKIKVAVLNSTKEAGLAKKGSALLDKSKYSVISTSNSEGEYDNTVISVLNKNLVTDQIAKDLAGSLSKVSAKIQPLPQEEAAPAGADVVVILGTDFSENY